MDYLHPSLQPALERTLGVPLFQEQLLRMAMIAAGFSGGEAEELRRAFGFKRSEKRMREVEIKLRRGMDRQGITGTVQDRIVQSITSFALYGFPESHAASFALIAYASGWLKCHYLAAFTAAMLNNQPMGFYAPSTLIKDAQLHGLKFRPIDVLRSEWACTLEPDAVAAISDRRVVGPETRRLNRCDGSPRSVCCALGTALRQRFARVRSQGHSARKSARQVRFGGGPQAPRAGSGEEGVGAARGNRCAQQLGDCRRWRTGVRPFGLLNALHGRQVRCWKTGKRLKPPLRLPPDQSIPAVRQWRICHSLP